MKAGRPLSAKNALPFDAAVRLATSLAPPGQKRQF